MTTTTSTDIYADTFRAVYDQAIASGASNADAADDATKAASRAWVAAQ